MPKTIEFWFDFGSPTTYLAHTQLPKVAADTGARIHYMPMLLGGVFKATGNQSPVMVPAKGRWMGGDLARFARRYGVPFTFNPHFPINTRDIPGFVLNRQDEEHRIVLAVGAPNLKVQLDLYHCQIVEGDVAMKIRQYLPSGRVGHLQIAGVPERHEPDVGEMNYT